MRRLNFRQRAAFMHGDVISRVTLDLELRILSATVVSIALVFHVFCVHLRNCPLHVTRFRVPTNVISNREFFSHYAPP